VSAAAPARAPATRSAVARLARGRGRRLPRAVYGAAGLLGFLVVVQLVPAIGLVSERYLPPTTTILDALGQEVSSSAFWTAVGDTMQAWAIGLAIAFSAGLVLGVVIGSVPFLRAATSSTIEFLRPIPSVALIPLAVLLFGSGLNSTLLLVIYASFWQVLVQVLHGVVDVDPVASDTARSFRFGRWARVRHVVWPTALPYVMTGLRLAAAVALILAVTAELVIGAPGLGHEIAVAQDSGATADVYALVVATGLIGVIINVVVRAVERRALHWHPSVRAEAVT
jgi:ABC-type nitrate/sulfonate/bicarbonate transport system permease component